MSLKIDLHTHCADWSACGRQSIEQIVASARAHGMDAVCLTDHDTAAGAREAATIAAETGFPIFVGMELSTLESDVLLFGSDRTEGFNRAEYAEIRDMIDFASCALIPAHAFRGGSAWLTASELIRRYHDDFAALEAFSTNIGEGDSEHIIELAAETSLPIVAGSDAHAPGLAGRFFTEFDDEIGSVAELVAALKAGRFRAGGEDLTRRRGDVEK